MSVTEPYVAENRNLARLDNGGLKWTPQRDWHAARIVRHNWSAGTVLGLGQMLVSGDLPRAREALAPGSIDVGLWSLCESYPAFIRIGRDRALLVTERPLRILPGWRAEGWAASPQDDAYCVLEMRGTGVADLVAEATSVNTDRGSPSASVLFASAACLLYRHAPDIARLHVEMPFAPYVWQWLEAHGDAQPTESSSWRSHCRRDDDGLQD